MKIKLTKRSMDAAKTGARDLFLWDTEAAGSGCKVTPKGPRVFIFQYWANGRARRVTLGRYGSELTVEQARIMSRHLRCKNNHRHRSGYVDNSLTRVLAHTHYSPAVSPAP